MAKARKLRPNAGHSLEVLPDIHPTEVDNLSATVQANNGCTKLGSLRAGRVPCLREVKGPWDEEGKVTVVPTAVNYDGRTYNRLGQSRFNEDPCKYYRNVFPWSPEAPQTIIPAKRGYKGLGKPPVRQYYKLTPKRVTSDLIMPSYEILRPHNPAALCHYYKHAC